MIISKSNVISNNSISLNTGRVLSGALSNLQDPDFSRIVSSSSTTFKFTVSSVGSCQYVALHGLNLAVGNVVTVTGTSFSKTFTVTRPIKNLVFYTPTAITLGSLSVEISGAGTKVLSYMQAGLVSHISWGTSSGQPLYYLGNNLTNRVTPNGDGMPVNRVQETNAPKLSLNFKNMYKAWARTDLQEINALYNETGILSQLDYEEENQPEESCALFELSGQKVSTHSSTTTLVDVSFSVRVVA
jgi:hypothetical protein